MTITRVIVKVSTNLIPTNLLKSFPLLIIIIYDLRKNFDTSDWNHDFKIWYHITTVGLGFCLNVIYYQTVIEKYTSRFHRSILVICHLIIKFFGIWYCQFRIRFFCLILCVTYKFVLGNMNILFPLSYILLILKIC